MLVASVAVSGGPGPLNGQLSLAERATTIIRAVNTPSNRSGISIAQALGMHRLPSAEQWTSSVASAPLDARVRSLVAYELKKRVFWALTAQAWFLIPLQRTTPVQPTQITTPLPCNARDE